MLTFWYKFSSKAILNAFLPRRENDCSHVFTTQNTPQSIETTDNDEIYSVLKYLCSVKVAWTVHNEWNYKIALKVIVFKPANTPERYSRHQPIHVSAFTDDDDLTTKDVFMQLFEQECR